LTPTENSFFNDLNISHQKDKSLENTIDISEILANLMLLKTEIMAKFVDMTSRIDATQRSQARNAFVLQRVQDQIRDLKQELRNRA
jgi:hypothetical protein